MPSTCRRSAASSTTPQLHPAERTTTFYLLNPDPEDPYFRQYPGKFRAELNDRLSSPLYGLLFAVLPLVFLGQAESPRQSRAASATMAVIVTTASAHSRRLPAEPCRDKHARGMADVRRPARRRGRCRPF